MTVDNTELPIVVVGAGPVGILAAIYFARRGYSVDVYERRGDMRIEMVKDSRSISLTLAERGLNALDQVGLKETVLAHTIPLGGRVVHMSRGAAMYHPYGKDNGELIYAILRDELCRILIDATAAYRGIRLHFHQRCLTIDKDKRMVCFRDDKTGCESQVAGHLIIGADGAFSSVRQQMQRGERVNFRQEYLEWGYKELIVPSDQHGRHTMEKHALHIWPRGDRLVLALPGCDGSFTCTCTMPFEGPDSFATLTSVDQVQAFFATQFPDLLHLTPTLVKQFLSKDPAAFVTTYVFPWHYRDHVVLIGDSAHAMCPFYGQGLNAGLEDCMVLNACMDLHPHSWESAFALYESRRKRNTDILAELSKQNFVELRDTARSPLLTARKQVHVALNRLFPTHWVPLYTMITHTTMPCADALERARKQDLLARCLGIDVIIGFVAIVLYFRQALGQVKPPMLQSISLWPAVLPNSPTRRGALLPMAYNRRTSQGSYDHGVVPFSADPPASYGVTVRPSRMANGIATDPGLTYVGSSPQSAVKTSTSLGRKVGDHEWDQA